MVVSGSHTGQSACRSPALVKQLPAPSKERYSGDDRQNRRMCSVFPFNSILSDMHPTIIYGASTRCQAWCWVYRD